MEQNEDREFGKKISDFRQSYFVRILVALGISVWLAGSFFLLLYTSFLVLLFLVAYLCLCILAYQISKKLSMVVGEVLLVFGSILWIFQLIHAVRDPITMVLPILLAFIAFIVLSPALATAATILLVAGQVYFTYSLFQAFWLKWQMIVYPLTTIMAAVLAYLRQLDFETIFGWVNTSILAAMERLQEAREHRGKLYRTVKDLDDAYHRLERSNEMLIMARAAAEQARQERNQFALTVSHELRTPLGFIIGFSEVMVNSPQSYGDPQTWPPGLYEDITEINRSSTHLLSLLNDVLDLGKADANRLILAKELISAAQVINEVEAILKEAIQQKNLWFKVALEEDLPELYLDRTRIRQVLINLISNSLRFTQQGGITVSAVRRDGSALFSVRDTGPGIAQGDIEKVFEEFGQAATTVWRRRDGSGLGIPISRRFVEMHGGEMWVESEVGQGTCFYFTLPLLSLQNWFRWTAREDSDEYWKFKAIQNRAKQMILVLSNNAHADRVIQSIVEDYEVAVAVNSNETPGMIKTLQPQALIIDACLENEPDTAGLLQRLPYDLPVVFLDIPGSEKIQAGLPAEIIDYLPKPILREDLKKALARIQPPVTKIWVIDDEEAMIRFVRRTVNAEDSPRPPELLSAVSGQDAHQQMKAIIDGQESVPDVILLDLTFPDTSGWDLLADFQRQFPAANIPIPPVILITAASLAEEISALKRHTLKISTMQPLSDTELRVVLKSLIQGLAPKLIQDQNVPAQTEIPSGKSVS